MTDERLGVTAVVGEQRDADAGAHLQLQAVGGDREVQGEAQAVQHLGDAADGVDLGQHDGELVAAEPRDGVDVADGAPQVAADLLEDPVAMAVAEGVVDLLEAVQVDEEHRGGMAPALGGPDGLLEAILQEVAVRQAGEGVVQRLALVDDDLAAGLVDGEQRQSEQR